MLSKVIQPLFFAREDTRTPFRMALWGMLANALLALGLSPILGFAACALATSLSAVIVLALLWREALRRYGDEARLDPALRARLPRMAAASLLMGAVCLAVEALLGDLLTAPFWRYPALAALIVAGLASYAAAAVALGAVRPADLKAALRRG